MNILKKLFGFNPQETSVRTEIVAGLTTFLTMAYILAVNPSMFKLLDGMPEGAVFTSTALAAIVGCVAMAFIGKLPFGLAPGMGLNALFTYTIILEMGNSWETALAAVFVSSIIFLIITVSGLREKILNIIPIDLKLGIGAGIGFFLAFLGLKSCGIIIDDPSTLVSMGGVPLLSSLSLTLLPQAQGRFPPYLL